MGSLLGHDHVAEIERRADELTFAQIEEALVKVAWLWALRRKTNAENSM